MQRDIRTYLADIQQAIADIELFTSGKSLTDYENDLLSRRAVEREFTIIAEAISRLGKTSPELQARIDHVRTIAGFRNLIVHAYHSVDDAYVWKVVKESLPLLKQQIDQWANELDKNFT
jgi:uncharacterized protein with HEPN domain